jgi:hypothetical protein
MSRASSAALLDEEKIMLFDLNVGFGGRLHRPLSCVYALQETCD